MDIKKKIKAVTTHVRSHPAIYGYSAGVAVGITTYHFVVKHYIDVKKLVDLDLALAKIRDGGHTGLYFKVDDIFMLLIPAPEDFQP